MAAVGGDPWKISGEERAKHDAQFFQLKPVNGFITGAQARDFFMQSGLSTPVLGQIWTLADMNGDGKMDKLEFSVAMHLIKKKLQGYELPKVLPASLKAAPSPVIGSFGMQVGPMPMGQAAVMGMAPAMNPPMGAIHLAPGMLPQASLGTGTMTTGSVGMPLMANGISPAVGPVPAMGVPVSGVPAAGAGTGWAMPHPSKLKYTQLFNTHDRNKRGFLTGVEARGILMQSGLPQPVLAQIWQLSDYDNDGKLTCDEFCIAMHLSDLARMGRALPPKLPPELIPSKARSGSFGAAGAPIPAQPAPQQKDSFGDLLGGFGMNQPVPPAPGQPGAEEKLPEEMHPVTFEDKRKENFDKGQAELDRRRALLAEQLKAEENARLEKERQEAEKRERQRLEQEAKRQQELQRQLEKQRKIEMEREEQRRKMMEQREQARRELERQRQMEWERQRKEQLMAEKQREYEQLTTLKSQATNLKNELESLDVKKSEFATKISQVRNGVTDLTSSIENMRVQRDQTLADIDRAEKEIQELNVKLSRLNGEKEQLNEKLQTQQNTPLSDTHRTIMHSVELKRTNVQKLRRELEQMEQETESKLVDIDNCNGQLKDLQNLLQQLQRELPALQQKQQESKVVQQQQELEKKAKERQRQEQLKKELEAQRKREEAEKAKPAAKQDAWFDFNSSDSGAAAGKGAGLDSDAWSSAFSAPASKAGSTTTGDVWGVSDAFASQAPAANDGVKRTKYKVLFEFEARSDDELTVNPGEEIWVLDVPCEPGMEEWFKGELHGRQGWFPKAYVEKVDQPVSAFSSQSNTPDVFGSAFQPVQSTATTSVFAAATAPAPSPAMDSTAKVGEPKVEESFQPTPGEAHKAPDGMKAQALYQWKARQDNHLSFNKDDIILVKEQEEMWWMGEINGKVGWFPKAYVRLLEADKLAKPDTPQTSSQTPSPMGTLERNGSTRESSAERTDGGEYYVAMYSYSSGEPADLVFNEGDMILVTKKEEDWWTGTLGDKTGIFPANYVKKVEIQVQQSEKQPVNTGPVAPPRRRSKLGSLLQAKSDGSSSASNLGAGSVTLPTQVAPPRRRARSKLGSFTGASPMSPDVMPTGFDFGMGSPQTDAVVAPPRQRSRSKMSGSSDGSSQPTSPEVAATFQVGTISGLEADGKPTAPRRRSKSKVGSTDASPQPKSAEPGGGFDFGDAFATQLPAVGEESNKAAQSSAVDFQFGADFADAIQQQPAGEAQLFGFGADFASALPSQASYSNTSETRDTSDKAGTVDFGTEDPFASDPFGSSDPFDDPLKKTGAAQSENVDFGIEDPFGSKDPCSASDLFGSEDPFSTTGPFGCTGSEATSQKASLDAYVAAPVQPHIPDAEKADDKRPSQPVSSASPLPAFMPASLNAEIVLDGASSPKAQMTDDAAKPSVSQQDESLTASTNTTEPLSEAKPQSTPQSGGGDLMQAFASSGGGNCTGLSGFDTASAPATLADQASDSPAPLHADPAGSTESTAPQSHTQSPFQSTTGHPHDSLPSSVHQATESEECFPADTDIFGADNSMGPIHMVWRNTPVSETTQTSASGSLFDLDFGSLMSATGNKNKNLRGVDTPNAASPVSFYIGENPTMSASSSTAELSALMEKQQTQDTTSLGDNINIANISSPLSGRGTPVNIRSPVLESPSPALSRIKLEDLPPTPPPPPLEETSPLPPPRLSSLARDQDKLGTTDDSNEPGQKSAKKPEIAMVIAPYTATGTGQLSLEPGNLINVRQKSPRGWWEGELQARGQRKKIGWFPANYVKLLGSSSARSTPDPSATLSTQSQPLGGSRSGTPLPMPAQAAPSLNLTQTEQVVALYAYAAQNEDELSFEKDAVITVLGRDNPDWWQGEVNGQTGLFPSNYVTPLNAKSWLSETVRGNLSGAEKQRQNYIQELITTEENYNADMSIVLEVFRQPMLNAKVLTEEEAEKIFVNWNDLIICNKKFLQALRVRKKMCGKGKAILMIGDILCENLPHMTPYVRFCSCQLSAAALLQRKTETRQDFVEVHKKCVTDPRAKGMPLSSFLLKPMQRITKYPLLIKEILKHTPEDHADYGNLIDALQRAEELCNQVNEGVRQRENSDRLEWIQAHVHCDGLAENITFNSVTNCLGPRKLLHCGVLYKVKSNKELVAFLFNDFLLLTIPPRPLGPSASVAHVFDSKSSAQFKMYKNPIVLNEILVKKPPDADADPCQFQVSHIDRVYHFRTPNETERDLWMKHMDSASRQYLDTERKKRERQYSMKVKPVGRLLVIIEEGIRLRSPSDSVRRLPGVGRLMVLILEACDLRASDASGKSDPYCEVSMGSQEHKTRVIPGTLNPKWNASMQFTIRDLHQDVLCITVYDRDLFSPNDFLGRTEVRIHDVLEEAKVKKGPITKRLILHEVETGEVIVKLDLQLYES